MNREVYTHSCIVNDPTPPVVKLKVGYDAFLLKVDREWCKILYPVYQDEHGAWYYLIKTNEIDGDRFTARVQNCFLWDIVGYEKEDVLRTLY